MKTMKYLLTLSIFIALLLAGCAEVPVQEATDAGEASDQPTGTITLYTSESEDNVNKMVADFNEQVPGVQVDIFRSGTGEVIAKLQAEMEAGEVQADVIWFADIDFFANLAAQEMLMSYQPAGSDIVPDEYHYNNNQYQEVRLIFNVVAYNTNLVSEPPTSWKDLTNPEYAGKVGMPSALYSGAAFNQVGTFVNNPEFGWDFYDQLNDNGIVVEQGNGAVAEKLATGEFALVQVVDFMARSKKNEGSPVDHIWPVEGALLVPTPIGILNNTDNPEAAQAFIDYMYTDSAQSLFVEQGYIGVVPGGPIPEGAPDLDNLKALTVDTEYISANRDEIRSTFEEKFGAPQ
ncbi:MAG: ABC transporter substrate-binding protein [Caldilineaceae bacterium]|nr:ABC transporter substrate-binding protein [Caldilineaceae bacterium]